MSTTKLQTSRSKTTNSLPEPSNTDIVRTDFIHGILNDTSIASIVDKKNDRHVFFQEKTGIIRHVWYPSSSKQWTTGTNLVATSDAKNHTPLSAVLVEWSDEMVSSCLCRSAGICFTFSKDRTRYSCTMSILPAFSEARF